MTLKLEAVITVNQTDYFSLTKHFYTEKYLEYWLDFFDQN